MKTKRQNWITQPLLLLSPEKNDLQAGKDRWTKIKMKLTPTVSEGIKETGILTLELSSNLWP